MLQDAARLIEKKSAELSDRDTGAFHAVEA
jgi:hypothetical protein